MQKKNKTILTITGVIAILAMPAGTQASYTGTLSVATNADFPPYEYCDKQELVGIDMEIARMIAEELGMELEICNMSFDSVFDAVQSGKTRIFSDGYMDVQYAIVITEEDPEFEREKLEGKKVGATDALYGTALAEELSQNPAVVYEKESDAVDALENGEIDALILDEKAARYFSSKQEHLYICDQISDDQNFVIAACAADEELMTDINDALATMKETGELDKIVEKYLGEEAEEDSTEDVTE